MKFNLLLLGTILCACNVTQSAEPENSSPIRITLHDSRGLSSASAPDHKLELNLFKSHTHIHLRISNTSEQELTLWRPNCPKGDDAMIIEFRDPGTPTKVFRARPGWSYTGGMGLPKVFTLAAHDDLIVNLGFVGGLDWVFPIPITQDERKDLEVRVGYRSHNLTDGELQRYGTYKVGKVWEGEAMGDWQKISVRNASGRVIGRQP